MKMISRFFFFIGVNFILYRGGLTATIQSPESDPHFSYNTKDPYGPGRWHKIWPACRGSRQSPVNIDTARALVNQSLHVQYRPIAGQLPGILKNNGHVPVFSFKPTTIKPVLTGVPHHEADDFILEQLHLHFNDNGKTGSEHTIDGKYFSGEFHLVHYKRKYGSFLNAVEKPDGLAVIAVFIQDLSRPSPLHVAELIVETEETTTVDSTLCLSLNPIEFLPTNRDFYTYTGSLTTPACQESVTWVVMATAISIPDADMEQLRQMKDIHGIPISRYGNCRPQTDMGTRVLEANFKTVRYKTYRNVGYRG